MQTIAIKELLDKTNLILELPQAILDMEINNPFRITDEFTISVNGDVTTITILDGVYEFNPKSNNNVLILSNEYCSHSFDMGGNITSYGD